MGCWNSRLSTKKVDLTKQTQRLTVRQKPCEPCFVLHSTVSGVAYSGLPVLLYYHNISSGTLILNLAVVSANTIPPFLI